MTDMPIRVGPAVRCFARLTGALLTLTLLAGCGGGKFGRDLEFRPTARAVPSNAPQTVRLPKDAPFNLATPQSERMPALGGTATAESSAAREGSAEASAAVKDGGKARAGFLLGSALQNAGSNQTDFQFTVRTKYEYSGSSTPDHSNPNAKVSLTLFVIGPRNRLLREDALASATTETGALTQQNSSEIRFTVTLGPDEVVTVYLAGEVLIEVDDLHSAEGKLKVTSLEIDADTKPAPPVPAAP